MGMSKDYEGMARQVQQFTGTQQPIGEISDLVSQLESACVQASLELEEEFNTLKSR